MEQNPEEMGDLREAGVVRVLSQDETLAWLGPAYNLGQVRPFYQWSCTLFAFVKDSIHR